MKKTNKIFCIIITIISIISCFVIGGCDYSFKKAGELSYTEWNDQNGNISFRTITGGIGNGYIMLSDKKIEAEFVFGIKNSLQISVLYKDLNSQESDNVYEISTASFSVSDLNKHGQVVSEDGDVILFGEHFGRIILTYIEINPNEVDAWEYYDDWSDSSGKLILSATREGYFYHKYRRAVAVTSEGEKEIIFQWLPEDKKFIIFSYVDSGFIPDHIIAEGTYTNIAEEVMLNFTMDSLFDGAVDNLKLRIIK